MQRGLINYAAAGWLQHPQRPLGSVQDDYQCDTRHRHIRATNCISLDLDCTVGNQHNTAMRNVRQRSTSQCA